MDKIIILVQTVFNFLSGKKTYILGTLLCIKGILEKNVDEIIAGLGMITLRAGISKN